MSDVLMVGSVALDSITTPHGQVDRALGGAATYAGTAASFFTGVQIVSAIGDDFPGEHLAFMASRGMDTSGVKVVDAPTFFWRGRYDGDMNSATTLASEVAIFEVFDPVLPDAYRYTPYVFLANIHPSLQLQVLDQVQDPKLVMLDTMNFWIEGEPELLGQAIERIDLLVINEGEARLLTGQGNLTRAGRELLARGPGHVIVKKGEHGALLFTAEGIFALPGFPTADVCDPTGCGDTFAGGLIGWLAAEDSLDEASLRRAIVYGSVIASFNVEAFSLDRLRGLTRDELDERFEAFRRLTHFESARPVSA